MALTEKITCDVCGIERGPANHWIMYDSDGEILTFTSWDVGYRLAGHLCGSGCATKLLSQKIAEWRADTPSVAAELDLDIPF